MWSIVESLKNVGRGRMITKIGDLDRVDFEPVKIDLQWRQEKKMKWKVRDPLGGMLVEIQHESFEGNWHGERTRL